MDAVSPGVDIIGPGICTAGIAIAGAVSIKAGKVQAVSVPAIRCDRIDRSLISMQLPSLRVAEHAQKTPLAPVIVQEPLIRVGRVPLQHCSLLPVPGPGFPQGDETLVIGQTHHANCDTVRGAWWAVIEIRLVGQQEVPRGVPRRLFIVAEEMVSGSEGRLLHGICDLAEVYPAVQPGVLAPAAGFQPLFQAVANPPGDEGVFLHPVLVDHHARYPENSHACRKDTVNGEPRSLFKSPSLG